MSKDKSTDSDEYYSAYDEFEMAEDVTLPAPVMPADEDYPSSYSEAVEEAPAAYESASEDLLGTYTGSLDDRISITVVLTRCYDNVVSGYYYYGNGDNGNLELDGYIEDDTLHFTEFSNGEMTGSWTLSQIGSSLVGTMTNYKGREFSVFLEK